MIDYDPHDWRSHFFDIKGSMLREIMVRVMVVVAWSAAVVAFHNYVWDVDVPLTVHSLVGVALGLLLVFRTNASYDRFWEGRKLWGGIVNETRNLARAARALVADATLAERAVLWTAAFPYAAMHLLRRYKIEGPGALGPPGQRLPPDEVAAVVAARHVPLAVAGRITATLATARDRGLIGDYVLMQIDQNTQQLIDYLGGCERILGTPLPFVYVVHLRRALMLYCYTLPFALVGDFGWLTVFDTLFVSYVFFGIEEIGVEIEGPFGDDVNDLPLDRFCAKIEGDLLGPVATGDDVRPA